MGKQHRKGLPFRDPRVIRLVGELKRLGCEVVFRLNDALGCNAETFYCVPPLVEYRRTAWETVDILHELLHIRQFYVDGFGMLAWPTRSPPCSDVQRTVKHLRNILDNTVVHRKLWRDYGLLPIHDQFFKECCNDVRNDLIGIATSETGLNQTLLIAERLWMAKMCLEELCTALSESQRTTCENFRGRFGVKHHDSSTICDSVRELDRKKNLADPKEHSESQLEFLGVLGLDRGQLHIAKYDDRNKGFFPV